MELRANAIMTSYSHRIDSRNRNATLIGDKMQGEQEQEKDNRVACFKKLSGQFGHDHF